MVNFGFKRELEKINQLEVPYYTFATEGRGGKLLVASGIHGDECSVIEPLTEFLSQNTSRVPNLIYIPEVSPSARQANSRKNAYGHDLNRIFCTGLSDPEEQAARKITRRGAPYDLVVTFHEDNQYPDTYFYDTGAEFYKIHMYDWRKAVEGTGISLLNGLDDDDNLLQKHFTDGYHRDRYSENTCMFEQWVLETRMAQRSLTIEIPTSATLEQKKQLIEIYFTHVILPAFVK
jgi:succinylglutamate desuccinylase